jgi:hypothetical protein
MEVLEFASRKWVYMIKSVEKGYVLDQKVLNSGWWSHLGLLLHFEVLNKSYFNNIFL